MLSIPPPGRSSRTFRKYGNFRDPAGLVMRMLRSGNRAAYSALMRAGLSAGTVPVDWLLQNHERRRLESANPERQTQPMLLIVGPPRSGSTLLYQILARHLDVSYVSNLTTLFPRSPITATRLLMGKRQRGGRSFQSYFGQTAGLDAPNDGFELWNRWLGGDRYRATESFDAPTTTAMRKFFAAWTAEFDRPFLNKNNRNAHCLALLAHALPKASFIVIRRDPLFVGQSLIEARRCVQGAKERSWGLASTQRHADADEPLGYVDDICDQLLSIESRLVQQTATVTPERLIETTYEALCRDPQRAVRMIVDRVPGVSLRPNVELMSLPPFAASNILRLSHAERVRMEARLATRALGQCLAVPRHPSPIP